MASSLPIVRDMTVFAGATFSFTFRWYSGGQEVDLTGWDAWMPYGMTLNNPLGELSVEAGTITLGADGQISVHMTDEESTIFAANSGFRKINGTTTLVYNLTLENTTGEIMRFMRGLLYVQYDVPRPSAPPVDPDSLPHPEHPIVIP